MLDAQLLVDCRGRLILDRFGDPIGTVEDVYMDGGTGRLEWALVDTAWTDGELHLVPLTQATMNGSVVAVPYGSRHVLDGPALEPGEALSAHQEERLYRHYGIDYGWPTVAERGQRLPMDRPPSPRIRMTERWRVMRQER